MWHEQRKDSRPVKAGLIEWETFKSVFLDRFFPRKMRKAKLEKFINNNKCNINVDEYVLKLTLLSKYAPSLVSNPRDLINRFMMGVVQTNRRRMPYDSFY